MANPNDSAIVPITDRLGPMPTQVTSMPPVVNDVVVLARNPEEMVEAQQALLVWADQKIAAEEAQLKEVQENLELAKKMKVRTAGWSTQLKRAQDSVLYYQKTREALAAGYAIIPDFPIQVIAVRTNRKVAPSKTVGGRRWQQPAPPLLEKDTSIPAGEGQYVSPTMEVTRWTNPGGEGQDDTHWARSIDFRPVDFPFKVVRPQILSDLDHAMKLAIFDEIGILPAGRPSTTTRRVVGNASALPDPMVIGRIYKKGKGNREIAMSFLITWWVDSRTL